uniref:DUF6894 domain-containing protein n=1 Tax=Rhodopseudomonas palustris (strain BisA53) TaxID=316055 RepID=Q07NX0_RHOP5
MVGTLRFCPPYDAAITGIQHGTLQAPRCYIAMPKYFFNVRHEKHTPDFVGTELSDKHAAWENATRKCGEIIREIDGDLKPGREWQMEVTDEFANPIYVIHISAENK